MTAVQTSIVGIGIILLALIVFFVGLVRAWFKPRAMKYASAGLVVAVGAGLALLLLDKISELSFKVFGTGTTIKTKLEQAVSDADEISMIKSQVLAHSQAIKGAVAVASEVQRTSVQLSSKLAEAEKTLVRMDTNNAIVELIMAAQANDRWAWDKLAILGSDTNSPFAARLMAAWQAIEESHNAAIPQSVNPRYPGRLDASGLKEKEVSLSDPLLRQQFPRLSLPERAELMQWVFDQSRFKRKDKLEFFIKIRETEGSLYICEWAGRHFMVLAPMPDVPPLRSGLMNEWWQQNKDKITD